MTIVLSARDLSYSFLNQPPLFDGVNIDLKQHEHVALMGDNGSGKTTFLQTLIGLYKPKKGRITILGKECTTEDDFHSMRPEVGFLFQDPDDQLIYPTVIDDICFGPLNIGLASEEAIELAETVMQKLQIEHLRHSITHELSGGQKRLVTLAGVLVLKPKILLLDEPTNALDAPSRDRLIAALVELNQAMIIVAHDDRILDALTSKRITLSNGLLISD